VAEARHILDTFESCDRPSSEFWCLAYHPAVLDALCRLRAAFLVDCSSAARIALRGIVLGALHGPRQKTFQSYFSNQCPRTYAPKPAYATRFWRERELVPEQVDVVAIIERRAQRYFGPLPGIAGTARLADSRQREALEPMPPGIRFKWVITSPPYYGMRTYMPDQWLRNWFLGGPDSVEYVDQNQINHRTPEIFAADLRQVWRNVAAVSRDDAKLVVRFGNIACQHNHPLDLLRLSLAGSGWRVSAIRDAGCATEGKRQATAFLSSKGTKAAPEYDVWAVKD
jgi:hypothetical protein